MVPRPSIGSNRMYFGQFGIVGRLVLVLEVISNWFPDQFEAFSEAKTKFIDTEF